jgi:hypothetical protein
MKRYAIISGILGSILLAIYIVSYFKTSRITSVQKSDGTTLAVRLMRQPWRAIYRPFGAIETAVRGKGFAVAYEDSK